MTQPLQISVSVLGVAPEDAEQRSPGDTGRILCRGLVSLTPRPYTWQWLERYGSTSDVHWTALAHPAAPWSLGNERSYEPTGQGSLPILVELVTADHSGDGYWDLVADVAGGAGSVRPTAMLTPSHVRWMDHMSHLHGDPAKETHERPGDLAEADDEEPAESPPSPVVAIVRGIGRDSSRPMCPLVWDDGEMPSLNPDLLGTLHVRVPSDILSAMQGTPASDGPWGAFLTLMAPRITRDMNTFALASEPSSCTVLRTADGANEQEQYVYGVALRCIRLWHLRHDDLWHSKWLHSEIARCIFASAQQLALNPYARKWTDSRIEEELTKAIDTILDARLLRSSKWGEKPDREPWTWTLGVGTDEAPYSALRQQRKRGGPSLDEVALSASRLLELKWLSLPSVTRAYLHALLALETGAFLDEALLKGWLSQSAVQQSVTAEPQPGTRQDLRAASLRTQRQVERWDNALETLAHIGLWGLAVGLLSGWAGAFLGAVVGRELLIWRRAYRDRHPNKAAKIARAMQWASGLAAADSVHWGLLEEAMLDAAREGAVWAPEGYQLVAAAKAHTPASSVAW